MDRLPAEAAPELLADHLHAMATQTSHEALRVALMDPIYDRSATAVVRRAAAVHATDPAVVDLLQGSTYPMAVFRALTDGPTLALFAARCADLVAQKPDRLADCPDPEDVMALAARVPGAAAELAALAMALTRAKAAMASARSFDSVIVPVAASWVFGRISACTRAAYAACVAASSCL